MDGMVTEPAAKSRSYDLPSAGSRQVFDVTQGVGGDSENGFLPTPAF